MRKEVFNAPDKLPPPFGAYSRAIKVGNLVFVGGHGGWDKDGNFSPDAEQQTEQAIRNIEALLEEAGATWANVVKSTTHLASAADVDKVRRAKERLWPQPYPTSTTVEVKGFARPGMLVEIDAIAVI
jgi:2-iminobutanoate/2-iminopropanoate deaminase